ncbi:MAG: inorganic phosphate transporter [Candidatus Rhabdochlamydia sp.]
MVLIVLFFDFTNGFHDVANVVAVPIATKVISIRRGILLAACFNFLGALQISKVAQTMMTGIIDVKMASEEVIIAATLGAIVWNLVTWYFAIPSSSSYALIGGMIGASLLRQKANTILWAAICYKVMIPMFIAPFIGALLGFITLGLMRKIQTKNELFYHKAQVGSLMMMAFAHGLNDTQKSMGIITLGLFTSGALLSATVPLWVIGTCALMMALGTAAGGTRIIQTLGNEITTLYPQEGCAAQVGAAAVVLMASVLGVPLSSTQIMTGSIAGIAKAKGQKIQMDTIYKMVLVWILTLPGAALTAVGITAAWMRFISH